MSTDSKLYEVRGERDWEHGILRLVLVDPVTEADLGYIEVSEELIRQFVQEAVRI